METIQGSLSDSNRTQAKNINCTHSDDNDDVVGPLEPIQSSSTTEYIHRSDASSLISNQVSAATILRLSTTEGTEDEANVYSWIEATDHKKTLITESPTLTRNDQRRAIDIDEEQEHYEEDATISTNCITAPTTSQSSSDTLSITVQPNQQVTPQSPTATTNKSILHHPSSPALAVYPGSRIPTNNLHHIHQQIDSYISNSSSMDEESYNNNSFDQQDSNIPMIEATRVDLPVSVRAFSEKFTVESPRNHIENNETQEGNKQTKKRCKILILLLLVLLFGVAAAFVGGYCGNGSCGSGSQEATTDVSPSAQSDNGDDSTPSVTSPRPNTSTGTVVPTSSNLLTNLSSPINTNSSSSNLTSPTTTNSSSSNLATKAFQTKQELEAAIDTYIDDVNLTALYDIYGPIEVWDVSKITDFNFIFRAIPYFNADISKWNLGLATDMSKMFQGCANFNADISNWDVSNVQNFDYFLFGANSFDANLSNWNVSNVVSMERMFSDATSFTGMGLENWDVSKVTNMKYMFKSASEFNGDISRWDMSNVIEMESFLEEAISFNGNLSLWDVSKVVNMGSMFLAARSFIGSGLQYWNVSNVRNMLLLFYNAGLFNANLSTWDVSNVDDMSAMFSGAASFNADLTNWNISKAQDLSYMFYNASSFIGSGLEYWDTTNVYNMMSMFEYAAMFDADLSMWNVYMVTSFDNMFKDAVTFQGTGLDQWVLGDVVNTTGMFCRAAAFNNANVISSWYVPTSGVYDCYN